MLEDISFNAGDIFPPVEITIDAKYVDEHVKDSLKEKNLRRFVL